MPTRIGPLSGYLSNVFKEGKQYGSAYQKASNASAGIGPGADKKAYDANQKEREELGQLLGAILQGRRYSKKGKQK